ncbi:hypothetical protein P4489_17615 [Heyndrickxia sporothermodurans]|uniref:Major facilitator superfamily (MFS) profile domain-containing protein n=3 Tax=Heyndrickxia sporothermodurans TaxID=46224 RepID=A0A150KK93_9BACI|nr:hypothetical protein [Heyndrickxia sporothermodurans]KYC89767.1 hypothetical protein B4102_3971 [Heyndrickxia sporothermodurans]MBL5871698.1 hypothetical protein [Heyndrickxia sporothermodurans]MED3656094.1 hypothetical protein [Heyndrickxia sporothermodurans]
MFALGAMVIFFNTPMQIMLQKQIDDDYKGRIFSILETMSLALMPLGMILYGFLYDVFPAQWILLLSAALLIGIVLILARPSVLHKAHPQLSIRKKFNGETGAVS